MIDLHTHTTESDGSYTPEQLVETAVAAGLEALGITDHDTFAGYQKAQERAKVVGLDLVCGVEVSTTHRGRSVHLLGYFLDGPPGDEIQRQLADMRRSRSERNHRLIERLQALGFAITLDEVRALGRGMSGRPHFAQVMVRKGYVSTTQEAFDLYLGEEGRAHIERRSIPLMEAIRLIGVAGGLAILAHPVRLRRKSSGFDADEALIAECAANGLMGIEAYHSDHSPDDVLRYRTLAAQLGLVVSGGSDFHGAAKPDVTLGSGRNENVMVPRAVLDRLRKLGRA